MDVLQRLLDHDRWATGQLLDACAELPDARLDSPFRIGQESLRQTFVHMIFNILAWTALMKEEYDPEMDAVKDEAGSFGAIRLHSVSAYEKFSTFARSVADADRINDLWLDTFDDPPKRKTFGGAILHVITHNMHHRAQIHFMLEETLGVDNVPETDLILWEMLHRNNNSETGSAG